MVEGDLGVLSALGGAGIADGGIVYAYIVDISISDAGFPVGGRRCVAAVSPVRGQDESARIAKGANTLLQKSGGVKSSVKNWRSRGSARTCRYATAALHIDTDVYFGPCSVCARACMRAHLQVCVRACERA